MHKYLFTIHYYKSVLTTKIYKYTFMFIMLMQYCLNAGGNKVISFYIINIPDQKVTKNSVFLTTLSTFTNCNSINIKYFFFIPLPTRFDMTKVLIV